MLSQRLPAPVADARGPFAQTRENYQRFALLLMRKRLHELGLKQLDWHVVFFLLARGPGWYCKHADVARELGTNVTSVRRSLKRIQVSGLIWWILVPHGRTLGVSKWHASMNRYWINLALLKPLLELDPALAQLAEPWHAKRASLRVVRSNANAPALSKSTAPKEEDPGSHQNPLREEEKQQPSPPFPPRRDRGGSGGAEEAISKLSERVNEIWSKHPHLGELVGPWVPTLRARRRDGASEDELLAAARAASSDEWLQAAAERARRGGRVTNAFAVVYANVASVRRFAHEGFKELGFPELPRQAVVAAAEDGCPDELELVGGSDRGLVPRVDALLGELELLDLSPQERAQVRAMMERGEL